MAESAFVLAIRNVLALDFRETSEAFPAAYLGAVSALKHFRTDQHAGWALEVFRERIQDVLGVEVLFVHGNAREIW